MDSHYRILKKLENNANVNQRQLAAELGISLGKINYCLRALADKGWIRIQRFRQSHNKWSYLYHLTPEGIAAKARLTRSFLQQKIEEYDRLKEEIASLQKEVEKDTAQDRSLPQDEETR